MPAREHQKMQGGKLATLAILFLLLVVGFGLGLLAGAAYEEPGLLVEHLAGRTESVPLDARAPVTVGEGEGEAHAPALEEIPTPPLEQNPATPPAPTADIPHATAGGRFAVQVGAFSDEDAARKLAREVLALGLPVYIEREDGRTPFRVRVGRFATRARAEQIAHRLKREQRLPTWVIDEER